MTAILLRRLRPSRLARRGSEGGLWLVAVTLSASDSAKKRLLYWKSETDSDFQCNPGVTVGD